MTPETVNQDDEREAKRTLATVDSCISILNSIARMAAHNVSPVQVSQHSRMDAVMGIFRICQKLGITVETLKAHKEAGRHVEPCDMALMREISAIFNGARRR